MTKPVQYFGRYLHLSDMIYLKTQIKYLTPMPVFQDISSVVRLANMHQMLCRTSLRNQKILKPLRWLSNMVGCNIASEVKSRDPLKIISLLISLFAVVGFTAQCNFIWSNRHKFILFYTDAICTAFQCVLALTKMLHLILLHSEIFRALQKVQNSEVLWDLEMFQLDLNNKNKIIAAIQDILHESWNDIKKQLHLFVISICGICGWYFFYCLAVNVYKTYINPEEFDLNFPFPARFPMWRDKGMQFPYFFITYTIVATEVYLAGIGAVLYAGIFAVLSVHGIALMRVLRKLVGYATNDEYVPLKERLKYLKSCIKLQQQIYEYCHNVKSLYKIESVPFFVLSMFVKCLVIFQASLARSAPLDLTFRVVLYFSAITFEVSIFCFNGQRLTTESERLPFAVYDCQWYNESTEFKFLTRMMIMRSNRVVEMTVGGFTNFSLMTLLAIMRSSGSFFLLLREINDLKT